MDGHSRFFSLISHGSAHQRQRRRVYHFYFDDALFTCLDHGAMAHLKAFNRFSSFNKLSNFNKFGNFNISGFNRLNKHNRFSGVRLGPIIAAFFFALLLFYTTEFRRISWSCKTWATCLGGRPHSYKHWGDIDPELRIDSFEKTLHDDTLFFHRQTVENSSPEILILVLAQDAESWSKDYRSTRRNIYDFLDLLVSTDMDFAKVTLGFMTSSREEYDKAVKATEKLPFARVALYFREEQGPKIAYSDRHKPHVQRQRRARIASLRNYLMLRTLRDERHLVWMDADIVEISPRIVQTMIGHADEHKGVGIMTALCTQTRAHNYDKNAWAFKRQVDESASDDGNSTMLDIMGPVGDDQLSAAVKRLVENRVYVNELIENTHDNDLLHVDSVGATILYVRAHLVRLGVTFPASNVVGTTWSHDGWYGIETEGICYLASQLEGGGCFVLGGTHHVRHADIS
ncbi:glycosyltransferase family 62 protein [Xylariaceae sp. AK1471]|nr:glycosyltransferase family 62 protein [Xylariaceae sp. AK1471]